MADKYISAIGGTDDAAVTSGNGTVIALLKGLLSILSDGATGLIGILRGYEHVTLTMASGTSTSDVFDLRKYAGGILENDPSAWTTANIGFLVHHASTPASAFQPLYDKDHVLVEIASIAANQAAELPASAYGAHYAMLWSQTSASGTNQGGNRAFELMKKA